MVEEAILEDLFERFDPHDNVIFFYDPLLNYFTNYFGYPAYNIYDFITPNQLLLFKEHAEDMCFIDVTNSFIVELVYSVF